KLRLDTKEGAFAKRDGPETIVAGKSHESKLFKRIISADRDEQMPPPKSGRQLTPKQIETLKTWIDQGAKWGQHWAFKPLQKPAVPTAHAKWGHNAIDQFILAKLEHEKLKPSDAA